MENEMILVPRDLLIEVCERALSDSHSVQSEFSTCDADDERFNADRAPIDQLLALAKQPA